MSDYKHTSEIEMRVVYDDLPDLIEIETTLVAPRWSAVSRAYASPNDIVEQAQKLESWCKSCTDESLLEFGADNGIGWTCLRFYPVNLAGHIACQLSLSTGHAATDARDEETWRLSIEMPTEPGLVYRYAASLQHLAESLKGAAVLQGIAL